MADFSHSLQRIQAPATLSKKMSNGNGFTSKTVYDDVFGGPPKFGVPTFSSRVDDYSEIFSSYHASRGSSIPILDLPVVDEGDISIDVRSLKFDYSEVFGGFNSVDFAVSYEELFAEPKGGESSSEDVWTPAETGSPSEGSSEDHACSESNQAFLNGESHHSYDGVKQFNMSYHKTNQISKEDGISGTTYIAELNAVPAFTFVVDESIPLDKAGGDKPLPQVTNDYNLNVDFNGEIMVGEHVRKTMSDQPIYSTVARTPDSDLTPQRNPVGNGTYPNKVFVCVSEISLRTQPSQVPPPSRPPPKLTIKQGESKRFVASSLNVSENSSLEGAVTNGSPPFFDVEVDASSSAAASAAAMKEAMEIAQARLKCAKESMERKREGLHNRKKLGLKDDLKGKERRESEITLEARRFKEEKAHEALERENGEMRGFAKEGRKTTTMAAQIPLHFEARGKLPNVSNETVYQKHVKESISTQESHQQEEPGEWKAEKQFYELVKTDKFRTVLEAPEKEKSERKFMPTTKAYECDQNEKKAAEVAFKQPEESYGKSKAACEQEDGCIFEVAKEVHEWEENEKKIKEAHEQEEHGKKLKEAHEREEHEKKLKEAYEQAENEKKLKEAYKREEIEKKQKEALEREENEKREKMAHEREANEKRLKKAREQEAYEKRLKEVRELEEHEKRLKEAREREENEKRLQEAREREAYEKRLKEVHEQEEHEKRLKEVREREENEKRLKEALEREENEKMLKEVHEQEENEKRQKEESEREEHEKRLNEAREREENDKRQKEARKRELNEKRLMDAREREENEKKHREAHEREEKEKRGKEALEQEENETREQEACKREDNEEKLEAAEGALVHEEKNLNAVMELQESSESENKLKATNEAYKMGEDKNITRGAFELDENNKKLKENQDSCEHKGKGKRMDENERLKEPHTAQSANEHNECENKSKPASQAKLEGNGNKLREPEEVVVQGKNEKNKKVDQVSFGLEDNKNKDRAAQGMSTLVENGKKMEAAKPANALEERGDKLDTVDEVDRKRKEKNFNKVLILEEREKEERLQREREQEKERLRKIEEEKDREREREKDRMAVERATREARERAFTEARERAERAAVERATAEARQRAMAEAREKLEKASAEAREKSLAEKASIEGRLRAERAAVERATAEARERAVEKAMAGKAALEARERVERSVSEKFSATSRDGGIRQSTSFSDLRDPQFQGSGSFSSSQRYSNSSHLGAFAAERSQGSEVESAQRCKARLERHQRTVERAAKALAEKNMRDRLAQREQAERNRLAETLDADVKRWSSGKEGNLRALLSTLQYILGTESGWQPIPLTDVITAVAVKKAYRKATLCVHPDKLQQRGASIQQKYICEKVFDLLKEAWNKFNSEER